MLLTLVIPFFPVTLPFHLFFLQRHERRRSCSLYFIIRLVQEAFKKSATSLVDDVVRRERIFVYGVAKAELVIFTSLRRHTIYHDA